MIDLGVYGRDGFMIDNGNETQKRDIPKIDPALNHTTIGSLYNKRDSFDWVIHPGDAGMFFHARLVTFVESECMLIL